MRCRVEPYLDKGGVAPRRRGASRHWALPLRDPPSAGAPADANNDIDHHGIGSSPDAAAQAPRHAKFHGATCRANPALWRSQRWCAADFAQVVTRGIMAGCIRPQAYVTRPLRFRCRAHAMTCRNAGRPTGPSRSARIGLAATGIAELLLAILTGSVGLLGDAIHNLSDVSTSAVVFLGFRLSRKGADRAVPLRPGPGRGPGRDRDRRGHLGQRGVRRVRERPQAHRSWPHQPRRAGIAGAALGIVGNQVVARYKLIVGKRINSATLVADARHSWLDALSSAGALVGLVAVALGFRWGDPIAGSR